MDNKTADNLLKLVKDNYQKIAEDFNTTRRKEIWPKIRLFTDNVKNSDSVLDLGCGNGRLLEAFKEKEIEYLGIDNSSELIKLAENNYPNEFLTGDILDLGFIKKNNFDYIFCLAVLQHIPSKKLRVEVLEEMKNKLADNGEIVISNWNIWQGKNRNLIFKFFIKRLLGKNKMSFGDILFPWKNSKGEAVSERYYHAFTLRELRSITKKSGLKIKELYKDKYNYWLILKK